MPLGAASSAASRTLSVWFFVGILLGFCFPADGINLWPMPKSVTQGSQTLYLGRDFQLTTDHGSKYSDGSGILKEAFQRMISLVQASHTIDGRVPGSGVLAGVNVVVVSSDDQLNYGIDESYKLSVPTTGNPLYAHIEVGTSLIIFSKFFALSSTGYFKNINNFLWSGVPFFFLGGWVGWRGSGAIWVYGSYKVSYVLTSRFAQSARQYE